MRALIQRVKRASVTVDKKVMGKIDKGFLVLLGIKEGDTKEEIDWIVNKVINLRVFPDKEGKMNNSLLDNNYEILIVSQFTLYGNCKKGNRPSFIEAAAPEKAEKLYNDFVSRLKEEDIKIEEGEFQAMMDVELVNWGPVTLMIEK